MRAAGGAAVAAVAAGAVVETPRLPFQGSGGSSGRGSGGSGGSESSDGGWGSGKAGAAARIREEDMSRPRDERTVSLFSSRGAHRQFPSPGASTTCDSNGSLHHAQRPSANATTSDDNHDERDFGQEMPERGAYDRHASAGLTKARRLALALHTLPDSLTGIIK